MGGSRLYPGACCDACGQADALSVPRACDGVNCRTGVNQDGPHANAMRASAGACDNGYCGLPPMSPRLVTTPVGPAGLLFGRASPGTFKVGCGGGPNLRAVGAINTTDVPPVAPTRQARDAASAAVAAWLAPKTGETPDEAAERATAFGEVLRNTVTETAAAWWQRVRGYAQGATDTPAGAWVRAMVTAGWLRDPGSSSTPGWTPEQISSTVSAVITSASGTILALIAGARESDRQARQDAADAEARRLAAAATEVDRVRVGVEAASNARSGAQSAALLLPADRTQAVTRLSQAQGQLAAAQAARATFEVTGTRVVPPVTPAPPPPPPPPMSTEKKLLYGLGGLLALGVGYKVATGS
jgi:hypothetical protein